VEINGAVVITLLLLFVLIQISKFSRSLRPIKHVREKIDQRQKVRVAEVMVFVPERRIEAYGHLYQEGDHIFLIHIFHFTRENLKEF
jgi:hypothetical protein